MQELHPTPCDPSPHAGKERPCGVHFLQYAPTSRIYTHSVTNIIAPVFFLLRSTEQSNFVDRSSAVRRMATTTQAFARDSSLED